MKIDVVQKDILNVACDLLVVNLFQDVKRPSGATAAIDKALDGRLAQLIEEDGFEGKMGQTLVLPTFGAVKARKVVVMGLGDRRKFNEDTVRRIGGAIIKAAQQVKAKSVVTILHGAGNGGQDARLAAQALTEGLILSAYRFQNYHGRLRKQEVQNRVVEDVKICEMEVRKAKSAKEGVETGRILAEATILARDLVNTPSAHMTPKDLAAAAQKLQGKGLSVKVMDRKEMEKLGMGAALAVGAGSDHEPVGVHLTYRPRGAKKKVVIVGKAVTFDSGGLSIKPADGMMTMKIDMAGAAAVVGLFKALPELQPEIEVHGIFLAVENMPSGSAYRPGDVVTAMDGTTIEVLNTDAEGRVTLADALAYAKKLEPDMIIDLATLTGAAVVALGEDISALYSSDGRLADRLLAAAEQAGEPLWEMPLYAPYQELIKSKIADLKNIGGRAAGSITAALFLQPFVGDISWAHLDIAGPAFTERETRPDLPYGATGYGVRLLANFLMKL
jgi:leucyl aminopeptidase